MNKEERKHKESCLLWQNGMSYPCTCNKQMPSWEKEFDETLKEPDIANSGHNSPRMWIFEGYVAAKKEAKPFIEKLLAEQELKVRNNHHCICCVNKTSVKEQIEKARQEERKRIEKLFINHYDKIIQEWARYRGGKTFFEFCDNYLKENENKTN